MKLKLIGLLFFIAAWFSAVAAIPGIGATNQILGMSTNGQRNEWKTLTGAGTVNVTFGNRGITITGTGGSGATNAISDVYSNSTLIGSGMTGIKFQVGDAFGLTSNSGIATITIPTNEASGSAFTNTFAATQFTTNVSGAITFKDGGFTTNQTAYAPYLIYSDGTSYAITIEPRNNGVWAYNDVTEYWKFDSTNWTFFQSVSGPTPTQTTNLATKGYVDGLAYNPLVNSNYFLVSLGDGENYTVSAVTNEMVVCNSETQTNTVTLPLSPFQGQQVIVQNFNFLGDGGPVIVSPNGKFIDHSVQNVTITEAKGSVSLIYLGDAYNSWTILNHGRGLPDYLDVWSKINTNLDTSTFLRGDGTWATPAGGGSDYVTNNNGIVTNLTVRSTGAAAAFIVNTNQLIVTNNDVSIGGALTVASNLTSAGLTLGTVSGFSILGSGVNDGIKFNGATSLTLNNRGLLSLIGDVGGNDNATNDVVRISAGGKARTTYRVNGLLQFGTGPEAGNLTNVQVVFDLDNNTNRFNGTNTFTNLVDGAGNQIRALTTFTNITATTNADGSLGLTVAAGAVDTNVIASREFVTNYVQSATNGLGAGSGLTNTFDSNFALTAETNVHLAVGLATTNLDNFLSAMGGYFSVMDNGVFHGWTTNKGDLYPSVGWNSGNGGAARQTFLVNADLTYTKPGVATSKFLVLDENNVLTNTPFGIADIGGGTGTVTSVGLTNIYGTVITGGAITGDGAHGVTVDSNIFATRAFAAATYQPISDYLFNWASVNTNAFQRYSANLSNVWANINTNLNTGTFLRGDGQWASPGAGSYDPLVNSNYFMIYAQGQGTNTVGAGTNTLVLCENSSSTNTVILPTSPTQGQEVIVKHWSGSWSHSSVLIDGNGKYIDSFETIEMTNLNESITMIYSTNATKWYIISHVNETQIASGGGVTIAAGTNTTIQTNGSVVTVNASPQVSSNMVGMNWWNLKDHGAKFDGVLLTNVNITSAFSNLTCSTANFTSNDVGKVIVVMAAGYLQTNLPTTILEVISPTEVRLPVIAYATVVDGYAIYGTDDAAAWQAGIDQITNGNVTVYAPNGNSIVSGSFHSTKKAILTVPDIAYTGTIIPTLRIVGESAPWSGFTGTGSLSRWSARGSYVWCAQEGHSSGESLFSTTNVTSSYLSLNNLRVRFESIGVRMLPNPKLSAINCWSASTADFWNFFVDTGWVGYTGPAPTYPGSVAIIMPSVNNSGVGINRLDQVNVCGTYVGIDSAEGTYGNQVGIMSGIIGLRLNWSYHGASFDDIIITGNATNIFVNGTNRTTITNFKTEQTTDGHWYNTLCDVYDPNSIWKGSLVWAKVKGGVGIDNTWNQIGGTNCNVVEMGKTEVARYAGHYGDTKTNLFGGAYVSLTTNAPSDGQVLTATGNQAKWAAATGSQTPWTSDINAAGYALTNVNGLFITGTNWPFSSMANGDIQLYNSNGFFYVKCKGIDGSTNTTLLASPNP